MANRDCAAGFVPAGHFGGGEIRAREYPLEEDADQIYQGDAVILNPSSGSADLAAAGEVLLGVAANTPADGDTTIMVYDDPNIIYVVQGYTGVTFAAGMVGETADLVATAGSSTTKISLQELNEPELEANRVFLILGLVNSPDNAWGEHCKMYVRIQRHLTTEWPST